MIHTYKHSYIYTYIDRQTGLDNSSYVQKLSAKLRYWAKIPFAHRMMYSCLIKTGISICGER